MTRKDITRAALAVAKNSLATITLNPVEGGIRVSLSILRGWGLEADTTTQGRVHAVRLLKETKK